MFNSEIHLQSGSIFQPAMLVYRECTTKRPDSLFSEAHEATAFASAIFPPKTIVPKILHLNRGVPTGPVFHFFSTQKRHLPGVEIYIKKSPLDLIDFILRFARWFKVVGKFSQNIPHVCWFFRWFAMVESGKKHLKNKNKCKSIGVSWKTSEKYHLDHFPNRSGWKIKHIFELPPPIDITRLLPVVGETKSFKI